jgi:hypothetical protein
MEDIVNKCRNIVHHALNYSVPESTQTVTIEELGQTLGENH